MDSLLWLYLSKIGDKIDSNILENSVHSRITYALFIIKHAQSSKYQTLPNP